MAKLPLAGGNANGTVANVFFAIKHVTVALLAKCGKWSFSRLIDHHQPFCWDRNCQVQNMMYAIIYESASSNTIITDILIIQIAGNDDTNNAHAAASPKLFDVFRRHKLRRRALANKLNSQRCAIVLL